MAPALLTFTSSAIAQPEPRSHAFEIALSSGYAIPFSSRTADGNLSFFTGMIPVAVVAGYKFHPQIMIGVHAQYGAMITVDEYCHLELNCFSDDVLVGLETQLHAFRAGPLDPWAGLTVGYELLHQSAYPLGGGAEQVTDDSGIAGTVTLGLDYLLAPPLGAGPFVSLTVGDYQTCSISAAMSCAIYHPAAHSWLTLGIRGVFDLPIR